MELDVWRGIVSRLEEAAKPEDHGYFAPDGIGGQNHGSLMIDYVNTETPDIARFAKFSITDVQGLNYRYLAEIFAGGQRVDGIALVQSLSGFWAGYFTLEEILQNIEPTLAPKLVECMEEANQIRLTSLSV